MPTFYDILGVSQAATSDEIRKAYRAKQMAAHPDHAGEAMENISRLVNQAYEVLSDPQKRAAYDQELKNLASGEAGPTMPEWGDTSTWDAPPFAPSGPTPPGPAQPWGVGDGDDAPLPSLNDFDVCLNNQWLRPGGPIQPETIIPAIRSTRSAWMLFIAGWVAIPVVAIIAGVISAAAWSGAGGAITLTIQLIGFGTTGCVIPLVCARSTSPTKAGLVKALFWIGIILSGLLALAFISSPNQEPFLIMTIVVAVPQYIASRMMKEALLTAGQSPQIISPEQAQIRVAGKVGDLTDALVKFTDLNVAKGIVGEKLTFGLLAPLSSTPGFRVFNGLMFPGTLNADVDHAVICGKKMALIDSKLWVSAQYAWTLRGGIERRRGQTTWPVPIHFPEAVERYRAIFPDFQVQGWILIHPNGDPTQFTVDNTFARSVILGSAQEVITAMFTWLTAQHTGQVDRRDLARVYALLKP